jgi:acetyl-CoA carboxylase biotin carboxyl carrier protein
VSQYPEVETVAKLLELAARYGLEELEVEESGLKVSLRAQAPSDVDDESGTGEGRLYLWPTSSLWSEPSSGPAGRPENAQPLTAPLTGVFYRADAPDVPPFVEVGGSVEEGQVVGLIEAMKIFSPIEASMAGTVVEVLVKNGQLVQHGDVLMYVVPSSAGS